MNEKSKIEGWPTTTNLFARRDDDRGTFQAKTLGNGEADALSRSCDNGHFAFISLAKLRLVHFVWLPDLRIRIVITNQWKYIYGTEFFCFGEKYMRTYRRIFSDLKVVSWCAFKVIWVAPPRTLLWVAPHFCPIYSFHKYKYLWRVKDKG